MQKGKFITFEGCEGVGKSWQIRALKEYLTKTGVDALVTREPGGSVIAEKIRDIILSAENRNMSAVCEALLYGAARAQHLSDIVIPALSSGRLVICDRFIDSTMAYQGYARGLGEEFTKKLNGIAAGGFTPDLTVFLDLSPELAFARKGGADKNDRLENLGLAFHNKVYEGYKQIAATDGQRFVAIDASGSKQQTHEKITALLKERKII